MLYVQAIMRAFRTAGAMAVQHIKDAAVSLEGGSEEATKDVLRKCAATTLNSKLVRGRRHHNVLTQFCITAHACLPWINTLCACC